MACLAALWRWPAFLEREYVVPIRALDETTVGTEDARAKILRLADLLAGQGCFDATKLRELNAKLFTQLEVKYSPQNTRAPNQPLDETLALGAATCTGLSLLLVSALRGLGVPARVAGTPEWHPEDDPERGNHNCAQP